MAKRFGFNYNQEVRFNLSVKGVGEDPGFNCIDEFIIIESVMYMPSISSFPPI